MQPSLNKVMSCLHRERPQICTLAPGFFLQQDRSTLSLYVLFITAGQIFTFSLRPVYHSTTDLHFLFASCLLQHDRSTLSLLLLFITAPQIYTFSFASGFITARWVCAFPFGSVCNNTTALHFLVPSCLLEHDRSTLSLSVLFITTRQIYTFSFRPVY